MTGETPERPTRDPQAERDYAEFTGWREAQGYDADHAQTSYGADVMAETFLAGMQAQRDLVAAQAPEPAPGMPLCACAHTAARHVAEGCMEPECGCTLPFRDMGEPKPASGLAEAVRAYCRQQAAEFSAEMFPVRPQDMRVSARDILAIIDKAEAGG